MPSADELALRRACDVNPDDDAPRLVYADWLDEHERGFEATNLRIAVRARHDPPYPSGATCPVPPPLPRQRSPFARRYRQ